MNKSDLAASIADAVGLSKTQAKDTVDAVFDAITQSLASGQEVRLVGFGTFTTTRRAATKGRNPQTGAVINIPASTQPKFRAAKVLKSAVN
ncbi:MAG: HU family DNA-binding protein [Pseudomonadota bacterium]